MRRQPTPKDLLDKFTEIYGNYSWLLQRLYRRPTNKAVHGATITELEELSTKLNTLKEKHTAYLEGGMQALLFNSPTMEMELVLEQLQELQQLQQGIQEFTGADSTKIKEISDFSEVKRKVSIREAKFSLDCLKLKNDDPQTIINKLQELKDTFLKSLPKEGVSESDQEYIDPFINTLDTKISQLEQLIEATTEQPTSRR